MAFFDPSKNSSYVSFSNAISESTSANSTSSLSVANPVTTETVQTVASKVIDLNKPESSKVESALGVTATIPHKTGTTEAIDTVAAAQKVTSENPDISKTMEREVKADPTFVGIIEDCCNIKEYSTAIRAVEMLWFSKAENDLHLNLIAKKILQDSDPKKIAIMNDVKSALSDKTEFYNLLLVDFENTINKLNTPESVFRVKIVYEYLCKNYKTECITRGFNVLFQMNADSPEFDNGIVYLYNYVCNETEKRNILDKVILEVEKLFKQIRTPKIERQIVSIYNIFSGKVYFNRKFHESFGPAVIPTVSKSTSELEQNVTGLVVTPLEKSSLELIVLELDKIFEGKYSLELEQQALKLYDSMPKDSIRSTELPKYLFYKWYKANNKPIEAFNWYAKMYSPEKFLNINK